MSYLKILPILSYLACIFVVMLIAYRKGLFKTNKWVVPATLGIVFLVFSLITFWEDGLFQFWVNHTTNLAGNQVWFDLLIAVTLCFYLIVPRAEAVGMKLIPWGIAVFATASIALLPMFARLIWLESKINRRLN